MTRYAADVNVQMRVFFDDNGEDDLRCQAIDAVNERMHVPDDPGEIEDYGRDIVGKIEVVEPEDQGQ